MNDSRHQSGQTYSEIIEAEAIEQGLKRRYDRSFITENGTLGLENGEHSVVPPGEVYPFPQDEEGLQ